MMEPEQVLMKYLGEMGAWETTCARLDANRIAGQIDFADGMRIGMEKYRPIFETYCSKTRAMPRESLAYSTPLNDPEAEKIVVTTILSPSLVEIRTQQISGHRKQQLYRLVLEENQWKLFERFIVAADGELIGEEL